MPRKKRIVTDEERRRVEALAAVGMTARQICDVIGQASEPTLRKHFRRELDRGYATALAKVAGTAYKLAVSGECPSMTMFFLKCRGGWKESQVVEVNERREIIVSLIPVTSHPEHRPALRTNGGTEELEPLALPARFDDFLPLGGESE